MGMKEQPFDPRDHEAFVREIDPRVYDSAVANLPRGVIPKRRGMTMAQSIAAEGTLYQSGIPFWIPPGDSGANGLSFTGTRGVFTLSAAAPMQYSVAFTKGCYCYLPAGSGGLVNGGLYWCQMSDDTNGEVFAETYSGTGQPAFISSPTALPHMTAGRITQITSEVTMVNGTIPANSMGPNGIFRALFAVRTTSSATTKVGRVKIGTNTIGVVSATTSGGVADIESIFQNAGVASRNTKPTANLGRLHGTTTAMASSDVMAQDTSVDAPFSFTMTIGATTDSVIGVLRKVSVEYGA